VGSLHTFAFAWVLRVAITQIMCAMGFQIDDPAPSHIRRFHPPDSSCSKKVWCHLWRNSKCSTFHFSSERGSSLKRRFLIDHSNRQRLLRDVSRCLFFPFSSIGSCRRVLLQTTPSGLCSISHTVCTDVSSSSSPW